MDDGEPKQYKIKLSAGSVGAPSYSTDFRIDLNEDEKELIDDICKHLQKSAYFSMLIKEEKENGTI